MFRSWKLGRAFGIGIFVHWTFFLLPLYVFFANLGGGHLMWALFSVLLLGSVFGCVILHELGHALMARYFGIGTRDITLYPIGGVARLERMSERPWEEFWIAVAGPAVNVVIALFLAGLLLVSGVADFEGLIATLSGAVMLSDPVVTAVQFLLLANVGLVAFNLLPAFPMDGGRVLRALLASWLGRLVATEFAVGLGVIMACGIFLWGVFYLNSFVPALVAVFVFFAGQRELAAVRFREMARHATGWQSVHPSAPYGAGPANAEIIDQTPPANQPGFSGYTWDGQARLWIYWRNGRPVHTIPVD
jgi:Zn-dependent protease